MWAEEQVSTWEWEDVAGRCLRRTYDPTTSAAWVALPMCTPELRSVAVLEFAMRIACRYMLIMPSGWTPLQIAHHGVEACWSCWESNRVILGILWFLWHYDSMIFCNGFPPPTHLHHYRRDSGYSMISIWHFIILWYFVMTCTVPPPHSIIGVIRSFPLIWRNNFWKTALAPELWCSLWSATAACRCSCCMLFCCIGNHVQPELQVRKKIHVEEMIQWTFRVWSAKFSEPEDQDDKTCFGRLASAAISFLLRNITQNLYKGNDKSMLLQCLGMELEFCREMGWTWFQFGI